MRRLVIGLWAMAALLTATGIVFLILPVRETPVLVPEPVRTSGVAFADGADPALAEEVIVANVFSTRRAPPSTRYTPPESASDSAGVTVDDPPPTVAEVSGDEAGGPVLFGTVVGPAGTQALLHLDPSATGPRLYSVGERDGGFRVVSIAPRVVVLTGPRGRVTLRLDREEERP
jgi:hypothetical protein